MARLDSTKRAKLPDSAFAYIDSKGRRRLPIHDEAHVRNALSRFNQVRFEDEAALEAARKRLLNAAKKYRIVPVGFISGQLQSEREIGRRRARQPVPLPDGFVTMLMTDVEGSTALVQQLGDRYRKLIDAVWALLTRCAAERGGRVVETRADEFFAVFERSEAAVDTAVTLQRELRARTWVDGLAVRIRAGIHSGYPTRTEDNYIGVPVHVAARICGAAHGGQVLVSAETRAAARPDLGPDVRFRRVGTYRLRGLADPVELYQVGAKGLGTRFPPPRTEPFEPAR